MLSDESAEIAPNRLPLPEIDGHIRLLLVVAPYYKEITDNLVAGAREFSERVGGVVDMVEVPGVLEIPTVIGIASRNANYDAFVALGCVVGDQPEISRYAISHGLTLLGLQGILIGNGVLAAETSEQAKRLADPAGANKGGDAVAAALHLIALSRKWGARRAQVKDSELDVIRLAGKLEGNSLT